MADSTPAVPAVKAGRADPKHGMADAASGATVIPLRRRRAPAPVFRITTNLPPGARLDLAGLFCDVFAVELAERFLTPAKEQDHALR